MRQAIRKNTSVHPKPTCPLCHAEGLSVKGVESRISLVRSLLGASSPLAVFWGVWAVVVLSFYAMPLAWSRPHIGKEVLEFLPTVANLNAATTIPRIESSFGVVASVSNVFPDLMFVCAGHAMSSAGSGFVCGVTSTRYSPTRTKMPKGDTLNNSAVAVAPESSARSRFFGGVEYLYKNHKPPEPISRIDDKWNHKFNLINQRLQGQPLRWKIA